VSGAFMGKSVRRKGAILRYCDFAAQANPTRWSALTSASSHAMASAAVAM